MTDWNGRRVFITGHTGFKGSWLSMLLQELGAEVTGYALAPPTDPSLFEAAGLSGTMTSVIADVRDYKTLVAAMRDARPHVVFHLAAQPLVRYSYDHPVETYGTNVMGTVHVLEAVRALGTVKAVIAVTSDKCYENREWVYPYRETDPMGGHDPYSSSKGCSELVIAAYRSSYFPVARLSEHGTAVASVRAGNVIGGGDWALDRLVPDLVRAFEAGADPIIRSPGAVRPWQHVLEALVGYVGIAERLLGGDGRFAEAWNFGPADEDARPVAWIVDRMAHSWGVESGWRDWDGEIPHEAGLLKLDCSKARTELGWRPTFTLEKAIDAIVAWHKAVGSGQDAHDVSVGQIRAFLTLRDQRASSTSRVAGAGST
ncbi:CDP-glucose 4,6-dehydratase [Allosphingosinicella deserti]|uniref:CDP-glucose 4,6-dehydratase n=1 Tax=Allosphingosinicella deserti TaxID=2116704 RepID=A0A2P7QUS9_9SPHN|nr:CDP-glucose 4,6-dehydratase [Sphingomonas deserti]PSJ41727.1 CDP-glucose 4,6-dehydratase [Sphingomonas deserti]